MRCVILLALAVPLAAQTRAELLRGFADPPDDARIMMRWWWFGPSVEKPQLEREMRLMKEGGIGGFEVQPVYPLELDDPSRNFRNYRYLSPEFLDALRFTSEKARELGLRFDLTLGSGWPFGGPHIRADQAAGRLRVDRVPVPPGATRVPLPHLAAGESLIAAFLSADGKSFTRVSETQRDMLRLPSKAEEAQTALFFVSSRTGQMVKRAAFGAEGFVLDHMNRSAIETHLKEAGEPMLKVFGSTPPYAIFSDSLEVYGADWTPALLDEFRKRRGYDLLPHLPALVADTGDNTGAIRHDWAKTLTDLVEENYLVPVRDWARSHNTLFRSQTYGTPPVTLSSNAHTDLFEGEAPHWRRYWFSRWAASAAHLYGKPVVSSETWTWLHSPSFRATPLDMKAEADLHFIQGINQFVGHGWPYSPDIAGRPGWRFYAAGVFNDHNPWWIVMPDLARYFQRVSYLLRQGKPANDVAIYLPVSDARASLTAGHSSLDPYFIKVLGDDVIPQVLDAGYNFDFIDDGAIDRFGVPHPVLVLPRVERIPLATYRKIDAYARGSGKVIALGRAPALAPGLMEREQDSPSIAGISRALFPAGRIVPDDRNLGKELASRLDPDVAGKPGQLGFIHRKLDWGDVYFLANTENTPVRAKLTFRVPAGLHAAWLDPFTAKTTAAGGPSVDLECESYGSRILIFSREQAPADAAPAAAPGPAIDISANWTLTFPDLGITERLASLRSWTESEETWGYSGQGVYEKTFAVPRVPARMDLHFGEPSPLPHAPQRGNGMRSWLDAPVRDAAVVYVNGHRAGSVWRPPYELDIAPFLQPGENRLRIVVANTAINHIAARPLPDYRLLNLRFTERFTPQDMKDLKPVPSGLLGPIRLIPR